MKIHPGARGRQLNPAMATVCLIMLLVQNRSLLGRDQGPNVLIYTARNEFHGEVTAAGEADESLPIRLEIHRASREVALYRGSLWLKSFPVAVGRPGWETPLGQFNIFERVRDPAWKHPLSGKVYRAGDPKNELTHCWLGFWTNGDAEIGFHGTPHPETVGRAASHGCIRMRNTDIDELFGQVKIGTAVTVLQ